MCANEAPAVTNAPEDTNMRDSSNPMRGYRWRNSGASHQEVVAPCPSRSVLSARTNVLVHAAPIHAPSCAHSRNAPPASATSRWVNRCAREAGIFSPSAGNNTASGSRDFAAATTGTENPCAVRSRRRTPTTVTLIAAVEPFIVPASSLAVPNVSSNADSPRSNAPCSASTLTSMSRTIPYSTLLPMLAGPHTAQTGIYPTHTGEHPWSKSHCWFAWRLNKVRNPPSQSFWRTHYRSRIRKLPLPFGSPYGWGRRRLEFSTHLPTTPAAKPISQVPSPLPLWPTPPNWLPNLSISRR